MKLKVKMVVEVNVDDFMCIPSLLRQLSELVEREQGIGMLEANDGDRISWKTEIK
jgi:hypothetical protein